MPLIGTRKYPKGPSLRHLETHIFNLSGARVKFLAPEHYHDAIAATPPRKGDFNLYDRGLFNRFEEKNLSEPPTLWLKLKRWRFKGVPLLDGTGVLGDMTIEITVSDMPEFSPLFRPRHLEGAIERYIYSSSEAYRISGECRMNWKVHTINNVVWVTYHSNGYPGYRNAEECYESVWHTPITDQHLLTVRFDQVIRKKRTRLAEVYQNIINKVMSSFEIQLSSDAQSQLDAVKANFPDETLNETLPPYEFEEFEIANEYELTVEISRAHNCELTPDEVVRLSDLELKRQKQMAKETRVRVIASHLRFKIQEKEQG